MEEREEEGESMKGGNQQKIKQIQLTYIRDEKNKITLMPLDDTK